MAEQKENRPTWENVGMVQVDGDALENIIKLAAMLLAGAVMRHVGNTEKVEQIEAMQGHDFLASGILALAHTYQDAVQQTKIDLGVASFLLPLALAMKEEEDNCTNPN